jgi:hypothetical protein
MIFMPEVQLGLTEGACMLDKLGKILQEMGKSYQRRGKSYFASSIGIGGNT